MSADRVASAAVLPAGRGRAAPTDDADLASSDELIVYKDEGEGLVDSLAEEKLGLLTETEQVGSPSG